MRTRRRIKSQRLTKIYWQRIKLLFIIILCFLLAVTLYWLIFLSDFFQIKKITINGVDNPETIELDMKTYFYTKNQKFVPAFIYKILPRYKDSQKNLLLFSSTDCSQYLLNKYPEIEKLSTKLDIKNGYLTINIASREISFLLCTDVDCYLLDNNGVVFGEAPETSGSLIRKIIIHQPSSIPIGTEIFPQADLDILRSLFELSEKDGSPFKINALELEKAKFSTIKIVTNENWYLLLNFNSDFPEVFQIIQKLIDGELKNKTQKLQYIDCRYLPRVYYLFK
jgi:hypothetical protein